jgi:GTP-binding protein
MAVEFVGSWPTLSARPAADLPEILVLGRSNCGKSSLINYILGLHNLARTSGQPGKTRLLNYFRVDGRYHLVDLPGYGFAKVSKEQRERWWSMFRQLLAETDRRTAVVHLLDVRHAPSAQDLEVGAWIRESGRPFAVAVTKIDKIGSPARPARYARIIADLTLPPTTPFVPTSAAKAVGRRELLGCIAALLEGLENTAKVEKIRRD